MPAISQTSLDATIRHQVFVERLKAGEVKKIVPFLRELDKELRLRLSQGNLTDFGRARTEALIAEVNTIIGSILQRWQRQLQSDLRAFALSEGQFEARALTSAINNGSFDAVIPAESQLMAAVFSRPLSVRGIGGGKLLDTFIADYTKAQQAAIAGAIRQGVAEGATNGQILQTIRGTRAARYKDGILGRADKQAAAVVRTAVQHISAQAREQTYKANADIVTGVEWVSTLDSKTTDICQSLDGRIFKPDAGPRPPAHINCRSTTVPVLSERFDFLKAGATRSAVSGPVDASETYYSWLKKQPQAFQDAALGPTRAKLLRDGGLSAERFAQLRLSKNFQPLTLQEMQRLEPLAFQQAGIKINPKTGRVIQ